MKEALCVLMCYKENLKSSGVVISTDSHWVARIITVGSTKPHLQSLAMEFCQLGFRQGITLEPQWILCLLNDRAYMLSCVIDPDDWCVLMLDAQFGPHTVDRFSSHYNSQLPQLNTKYTSPGSCGIDALTQDWSGHNNWLCLPATLK